MCYVVEIKAVASSCPRDAFHSFVLDVFPGDAKIMQFRGSFSPFAGRADNSPAPAIVIEQPANNSWAVAIWSIQNGVGPTLQFKGPPSMERWTCSEKMNSLTFTMDMKMLQGSIPEKEI